MARSDAVMTPASEFLQIENRSAELRRFEAWLQALADKYDLSAKTVFALDLALNEALINIISHGYSGDEHDQIGVRLEVFEQTLIAEITDGGLPFNPLEARPMRQNEDLQDATVGGRGIHLIRNYSDQLDYYYLDRRNHLRMVINREP